ncbi:alkaline phosphatase family protein [Rhodococcus sp. BP-252]|uniref:Phosphodiesterase n=1 Tax=Rhodococcoides kyotonense TaxID=398843 RepID=A0A177YDR2_9NOCA|nr:MULTISPECIES: nucleotide pyrophosphatase/phosphodiesterase family protein [Rhodococcus]MBY6414033.1 alkaline phosphatase family protein [Rhodococcus sp. BP-320]MBY6418804.1 alkaline phosphatase family protein [Rhodococcus sp. BP-321]MBY6423451.1 alkaline phosphatase family protein [Rhodococcus sp. BP-324]MBY6428905.1 alkaline phosphatase family protein [Rhodococcus sp. BP-323]MBY6433911.1 alkaline phosphatase family protein [Rhodococcus sp. BP-322]
MLLQPRYGSASLADVVPSILAHLGVPDTTDRIGFELEGARRICLLVVDGLGAEQLAAHPDDAPFLTSHTSNSITAGFPSTTATSLSSLGTGLPPGEHGIVGYLVSPPGHKGLMNSLKWALQGSSSSDELSPDLVPETFQPTRTSFEHGVASGVGIFHVGPALQNGSGLTRASLRGASFRTSITSGDLVGNVADVLSSPGPTLAYTYFGDLDLVGHVRGPSSDAWRAELRQVDRLAQSLAETVPTDGALVVVSDHGMVEVGDRVDYDASPALRAGVGQLGGEARMRYVYTRKGATSEVYDAWKAELGRSFTVVTKDEAVDNGWFGPAVSRAAYGRIGDLLALAHDRSALVRTDAESIAARLRGHHGSLTSAELLVPALVVRPSH